MVASNLAVGLAQAGHQVHPDGRGSASAQRARAVRLEARARAVGRAFAATAEAEGHRADHADSESRGGALPARIARNPAELVGSTGSAKLLEFMERQHFDIVVIDTPPVMAVADAAILAHRTSGVLFVVAADTTNRHAAQRALEQLERANGRFLGAVLNRADADRAKYRYASPTPGPGTAQARAQAPLCTDGPPTLH